MGDSSKPRQPAVQDHINHELKTDTNFGSRQHSVFTVVCRRLGMYKLAIQNCFASMACPSLLRPPELHAELRSDGARLTTGHRGATSTELYFDLVYFMPMQRLSRRALDWDNLCDFWLYYLAIFNAWLGQTFFNNRFDTDDLLAKTFALAKMTCVVGMAAGVPTDVDSEGGDLFIASYCVLRLMLVVEYVRTAKHVPEARALCMRFALCFSSGVAVWIAALLMRRYTSFAVAVVFWICGACIEYLTPFLLLERMLPLHHSHMIERLCLYTVLSTSVSMMVHNDAILDEYESLRLHGSLSISDVLRFGCCCFLGLATPFSILVLYARGIPRLPTWPRHSKSSPLTVEHSEQPRMSLAARCDEDAAAPRNSMPQKLRAYTFIYLHLPFTGWLACITLGLEKMRCSISSQQVCENAKVLAFRGATGLTLIFLGLLHGIAGTSHARCWFKVFTGALLMLTYLASDTGCLGSLCIVALVCSIGMLLDFSRAATCKDVDSKPCDS
mmetsp:Transcript_49740/g.82547  ORF Transcript_49740/g.82547 Transcript_49740/m.82547 type:complete len:499 (-) Transcript_49740:115-1611(-)